jgi:hypothetical protein
MVAVRSSLKKTIQRALEEGAQSSSGRKLGVVPFKYMLARQQAAKVFSGRVERNLLLPFWARSSLVMKSLAYARAYFLPPFSRARSIVFTIHFAIKRTLLHR